MEKKSAVNNKIPVAIYARVSSDKQAEGDSLEHQVSLLREYIKRQLGDNYYNDESLVYIDEAFSGFYTTLLDRPSIQRMFDDAENGRFKVALFKEISRMGRDNEEIVKVPRIFESYGVRVIATNDYYDSNNSDSKIFFSLSSVLAEKESEKISTRVSSGNREKARNGQWATVPPIGYKIDKATKRLIIDDETANIPRMIFDLYVNKRIGTHTIANMLNEMGFKTPRGNSYEKAYVRGILTNQAYIGTVIYGKTRAKVERIYDENKNLVGKKKKLIPQDDKIEVQNAHPSLIEDKLIFWKAQEILKSRDHFQDKTNAAKHPLVGIAICGKCGSRIICQHRRQDNGKYSYRYYKCSKNHRTGECNQDNIRADELESTIFDAIVKHIDALKTTKTAQIDSNDNHLIQELNKKETERKKFVKQQSQMAIDRDLYTEDSFKEIMVGLKKQIELSEMQIQIIKRQIDETDRNETAHEFMSRISLEIKNIDLNDGQRLRAFFHNTLDKIIVLDKDTIAKIVYKKML